MDQITTLLASSELTKKQKKLADYILDHMSDACFLTSTALANELDVSEATIVRFSKALGFEGYPDFQRNLREAYREKVSTMAESITVPAEKLALTSRSSRSNAMNLHLYQEVADNLNKAYTSNSMDAIEEAAAIILASKTKYIASTRSNTALGDYFHLYLKQMLSGVVNTNQPSTSPIDQMCTAGEMDCLILFSLPRYSSVDILTAQMAKDAGVKIIIITDKASSSLSAFADVLLIAPVDISTFFNSIVGPQFISELLLSTISRQAEGLQERLLKIDKYLNKLGNY